MKKLTRVILLMVMLLLLLCSCNKETPGVSSEVGSGNVVDNPSEKVESTRVSPIDTLPLPVNYDYYDTVYARCEIEVKEDGGLAIPISSVEDGTALECYVRVDGELVHVAALHTTSGYLVWYGICHDGIATGIATHPHINFDGEECIVCNATGCVFRVSDLIRAGENASDARAPIVISEDEYEICAVAECNVQITAFPWMDASLEEYDEKWPTGAVRWNDVASKDCIYIPYDVLSVDVAKFINWYLVASGVQHVEG